MLETNHCIFFHWINGGNAWESGCVLKGTYCEYSKDCNKCRSHVHQSDKSKIADLMKICVQQLQNV